jgi:hypothetical protein
LDKGGEAGCVEFSTLRATLRQLHGTQIKENRGSDGDSSERFPRLGGQALFQFGRWISHMLDCRLYGLDPGVQLCLRQFRSTKSEFIRSAPLHVGSALAFH